MVKRERCSLLRRHLEACKKKNVKFYIPAIGKHTAQLDQGTLPNELLVHLLTVALDQKPLQVDYIGHRARAKGE